MTPEIMRERVAAGFCPYCDKGPFIVVAGHVSRIHDIGPRELRDALNVTYATPLVSDEKHQEFSQLRRDLGVQPPRGPKAPKRELSVKARSVLTERGHQASRQNFQESVSREERSAIAARSNRSPVRRTSREAWRAGQPHGTRTKYELGCRCMDCRKAAAVARNSIRRLRPERAQETKRRAMESACPVCRVAPGVRCVSRAGNPSDVHAGRRSAADSAPLINEG